VRRVVVLGGTGFFGGAAAAMLRARGIPALTAARRSAADVAIDANDPASIRRVIRAGDVVLDAAGPFQRRSAALVDAAVEVGFDAIDIADSSAYVAAVLERDDAAAAAGVRLMPGCSSASTVSSAMIAWSGVAEPVRTTGFLMPTTRHTAVGATAASLLECVGREIPVMRGGRLAAARGFGKGWRWDAGSPLGARRGWAFDTPDALLLPRSHPTLRDVGWFVDPNVRGLAPALRVAARVPAVRTAMAAALDAALPLARMLGSEYGGLGCEVEDASGRCVRLVLTAARDAYRLAVIPAVLAAESLARGEAMEPGVVPSHRQCDPARLLEVLRAEGFELWRG
jgi:hypothetical protein